MKLLDLRCEHVSPHENNGRDRIGKMWEFIRKQTFSNEPDDFLDIGPLNKAGREIAFRLGMNYKCTGREDLDHPYDPSLDKSLKIITCLEVIEHLMNPLVCLRKIHERLDSKGVLFISYPRGPSFLLPEIHFNEPREDAFYTLITAAGFEIIDHASYRVWDNFKSYFTGFRPMFLRLPAMMLGIKKYHIYCLRKRR